MLAARNNSNPERYEGLPQRKPSGAQQKRALPQHKPVEKLQKKAMPLNTPRRWIKIKPVVVILLCFMIAATIISRYAEISRNHHSIILLEETLGDHYEKQELLDLDLASREDLARIEMVARMELGMKHPAREQVQYVRLPELNSSSRESSKLQIAANSERSIWDSISNLID